MAPTLTPIGSAPSGPLPQPSTAAPPPPEQTKRDIPLPGHSALAQHRIADARPETDLMGTPLDEFPPSYVFAPGFLHADRRGLVAYPGLTMAGGLIGAGLVRAHDPERARQMLADQMMAHTPEPSTSQDA
jgi:hypothetical protein